MQKGAAFLCLHKGCREAKNGPGDNSNVKLLKKLSNILPIPKVF